MENLINLQVLEKAENQLKKRIFTELQLNVLKKKLKKESLDSNEKTYYYKYIKPKLNAMLSLFEINNYVLRGKEHIIEDRIPKIIKIIKKLEQKHKNKKILVSGSYLYNRTYNDIDVFIFTKYNKEDYRKGKIHVNFLSENSIDSLFFSSLSKISISNFAYEHLNNFEIKIIDVLQNYEILINLIFNKENFEKELRTFLLETEYISKEVILNSKQLYNLRKKVLNRDIFGILSNTLINNLMFCSKKQEIRKTLKNQITDYEKLLLEYKNAKNIEFYIKTYRKAIENAT